MKYREVLCLKIFEREGGLVVFIDFGSVFVEFVRFLEFILRIYGIYVFKVFFNFDLCDILGFDFVSVIRY